MDEPSGPSDDDDATLSTGAPSDEESWLAQVARMPERSPPPALPPGMVIEGSYRIEERLGAGGMGVVYRARDVELQRDVAIKLPVSAAGERLVREATAIAQLVHPNVVTVHRIGRVEGQVYIAMEHVAGGTARTWRAAAPRRWREILAVYLAAGRGLAAAHRAGLVHRDFKPDNVLVGDDGRIRVADFGLAREIDEAGSGGAEGTPAYMAPEQRAGQSAAPGADQFGFCVALWEALHGERPAAGTRVAKDRAVPRALDAALARGLDEDPAARWPSMDALLDALTRAAGARRRRVAFAAVSLGALAITAGVLVVSAGGDRDACRADPRDAAAWTPARRDQVAAAFRASGRPATEDAVRLLDDRLTSYTGELAVQRLASCQATRDGRQSAALLDLRSHCLDTRRDEVAALVDVLATADADAVDRAVLAAHALEPLEACGDVPALTGALPLPDGPDQRAELARLETLVARAGALHATGRYDDGVTVATEAVTGAEALGYLPLLARALAARGQLRATAGDAELARADLRRAAQTASEARDDALAAEIWLLQLQIVTSRLGKLDDAEQLREFAEAAVARAGDRPRDTETLASAVGVLRHRQGRHGEAQQLLERALASQLDRLGADHPHLHLTRNRLASVLRDRGDLAGAATQLALAIGGIERSLGSAHPNLGASLHNLASVQRNAGDYRAALVSIERAIAIKERVYGADHGELGGSRSSRGLLLRDLGRPVEARAELERAIAIARRTRGPDHPEQVMHLRNLALTHQDTGDHAAARQLLDDALAIQRAALPAGHPQLAETLAAIGELAFRAGDRREARRVLGEALALARAAHGPEHPSALAIEGLLGAVHLAEGDVAGAERAFRRALEGAEHALGADHPHVARAAVALGTARVEAGDEAEARRLYERALAIYTAAHGDAHATVGEARHSIALLDLRAGKLAEARAGFEQALAILEAGLGPEHHELALTLTGLADALDALGEHELAVARAERALALVEAGPDPDSLDAAETRFVAARVLWSAGGDRGRARALAREAREMYLTRGASVVDLDGWLKEHR